MIRQMLASAAMLQVPVSTAHLPIAPVVMTDVPRAVQAWMPGEVRCGSEIVAATPMRRPWVTMTWGLSNATQPLSFTFDIDESGRTIGIHRTGGPEYTPFSEDVAPSLAATRFAPGVARAGCTIAYQSRQTAIGDTPVADLAAYTVTPLNGALPPEGWARLKGDGDCADAPRPEPLVMAFPEFRTLPATPGVRDWSMIAYDLDANGRPIKVHPTYGTGNVALSAAAVKAMAASRYTGGAHHGCLYPYWRGPATLEAPPIPAGAAKQPVGATCPEHHEWSVAPTLRFPDPYRRRSIEGWAILTYDVAPWGEVGNIHVVDAQPSADFGTAAIGVLSRAKVPTTQGLIGCVDRVRFKMDPPNESQRRIVPGAPPLVS